MIYFLLTCVQLTRKLFMNYWLLVNWISSHINMSYETSNLLVLFVLSRLFAQFLKRKWLSYFFQCFAHLSLWSNLKLLYYIYMFTLPN